MPLSTVDYLHESEVPSVWALMNYWPFCSDNVMLKNGDESCNAVNGVCDGSCQSHRVNMSETVNKFPVLALNEYSADIFKRNGLRVDYVAELGVDTDVFKPDPGLREEGSIFTSSAWANFPHKGMRYLQQLAQESNIRIKIMTGLTRDQVALGLKHADIYVFPSTYEETWGLCLTEAMASGCACISTSIAGGRAQIHDGMGLLVPPRDPGAIKDAIDALIGNKKLREYMGEKAREHVVKEHSLAAMGKRFENVYKQVILSKS